MNIKEIYKNIKKGKNILLHNFLKNQIFFEYLINLFNTKIKIFYFGKLKNDLPPYLKALIKKNQINILNMNNIEKYIINKLKNNKFVLIKKEYIHNKNLIVISQKNMNVEIQLNKYGNFKSKFVFYNKGKLSILFTKTDKHLLYLYDYEKHITYSFKNSDIKNTAINILKDIVAATGIQLIGILNNDNILSFTLLTIFKKYDFTFFDIRDFFLESMKDVANKNKDYPLIRKHKYYLQNYDIINLYIPNIFNMTDNIPKSFEKNYFTEVLFV
jgi:hypothetical protein